MNNFSDSYPMCAGGCASFAMPTTRRDAFSPLFVCVSVACAALFFVASALSLVINGLVIAVVLISIITLISIILVPVLQRTGYIGAFLP